MARGEQASEIGSSGNEEMSVVIDRPMNFPPAPQWLMELTDEKKHEEAETVCKIQRVPRIFRESGSRSKENYEPLIISLGPFHHRNPKLQDMEKHKTSMTRRFIEGTGKSRDEVYGKFLEVARNAKKEYYVLEAEDDIHNDEEFLHALFVDVCFFIQFILSYLKTDERKHNKMMNHEIAFVARDLFLLENQLPFPIVKALMMPRFSEVELFGMIENFINSSAEVTIPPNQNPGILTCSSCLPKIMTTEGKPEILTGSDHEEPMHLLHALQMRLVGTEKVKFESGQRQMWHSYRSVKELKAAGIQFKPQSGSSHLTDITFNSYLIRGVISIKPMVIDDKTKATYLNLCAFEELPNAPGDLLLTSYLCLVDSLIDSAEDVQELRARRILFNLLGSDEQVANLFNDITDRLVPNPKNFAEVKSAIEEYYNSRLRTWLAQFLSTHFSTPWTVIGFLLAAFAIILSVIQTFNLYTRH